MANRVTRRQFITRTGLAFGGLVVGPQLLAACGESEEEGSGNGGGSSEDVWFDNWTLYIDQPDDDLYGEGGTLDEFQRATGLTIKYTEDYNDNNEYFAKIQPLLSKGDPIGPNIIAPTFWLAGRLIQLGWVEQLPLDKVPNAANLLESLTKPPTDPTGEYSLPWQSGMAGIAYNKAAAGGEVRTMDQLLTDPALKGKIGMLTEMRDTMGLIAMSQGVALDSPSFADFEPAFEALEKAVSDGQVRQFTGNDYIDDLEQGNFAACIGWSGDVVQLSQSNPDIGFAIPESGGTLWFDTMVVPKGASNVDAVAEWMDFVYDPANAARIAAYVQYISPVQGVADELRKMGGEEAALADNPLMFPDDATLANLQSWGPLDEDEEQRFDEEFARITGA